MRRACDAPPGPTAALGIGSVTNFNDSVSMTILLHKNVGSILASGNTVMAIGASAGLLAVVSSVFMVDTHVLVGT